MNVHLLRRYCIDVKNLVKIYSIQLAVLGTRNVDAVLITVAPGKHGVTKIYYSSEIAKKVGERRMGQTEPISTGKYLKSLLRGRIKVERLSG